MEDPFKAGRIARIKVKGFMTYDELEINPNKGLNLIIGLNGSGKSSIMSAICLGLAGKPQYTGRSALPSEFIKYGQSKAVVEIELEQPKGKRNVLITRTIQGDKSTYMLNGSPASQPDVQALVKKYNIDVGNLCQFLPQEKVVEFSKMDKKQRLESMLQAIGEPQMFVTFNELKLMRSECSELERQLANQEADKQSEVQANSRLKNEVDKHEERKLLMIVLSRLNITKTAMKYERARKEMTDLKAEKKSFSDQKQKVKQELEALEADIGKTSSERDGCIKAIRTKQTKIEALSGKMSRNSNDLAELHDKVHLAKIDFRNMMTEKMNQKSKLEELEKQIKGLRTQYDQLRENQQDISDKERENLRHYEELKREMSKLDSIAEQKRLEINQHEYTHRSLTDTKSRLQNEENKKMQILRSRSLPTYDAVRWLQENRHSFKSTICNPALLSIKVDNDNYSKFIENTIAFRDLITFVCEDEEDMKRLSRILIVEKKLKINVAIAPKAGINCFQSPQLTPQMKQLGVTCFLKDLFKAPDPVMCYLCQINNIHRIPICNQTAEKNVDAILHHFSKFFTPNERITGTRSKYGNKNLSVKRDFIAARNILLSAKDQSEELQKINALLSKISQTVSGLRTEEKELNNQRTTLERRQEQLRKEKFELREKGNQIQNLRMTLQQKEELFRRKESQVIDERVEKDKMVEKIRQFNGEKMAILVDIHSILKEYHTLKQDKVKHIPLSRIMNRKVKELTEKLRERRGAFESKEREYEELSRKFDRVKAITVKYYQEIGKVEKKELNVIMDNAPPSLEELDQKILQIQAELDLHSETNDAAVEEYHARQIKIKHAQKNIDQLERQIGDKRTEMERKKVPWLEKLENYIHSINSKFTQYYKILKCAGEVSLDQSENPDNFHKYGLQIRLKYRVDEDFMELSQTHHSGGECSVAAIIFILSLQELTNVPFRCIDEINQGMDAVNERKIYQLIADASKSKSSCSQYFLLTPKLLMDLNYHADVKVHIIYNSHYLNERFHLKKLLRSVRA